MKIVLPILAVLCAAFELTAGKGCCTPDQWEGSFGSQLGYSRAYRKPKSSNLGIHNMDIDVDDEPALKDNKRPGKRIPRNGGLYVSRITF